MIEKKFSRTFFLQRSRNCESWTTFSMAMWRMLKLPLIYDNKIYKKKFNIEDFAYRYRREAKIRHRQNELEFQRPLWAKIKDNGDLQVFKKNILFHQYKISKSLMITQQFDYPGFLEDIANETQPMKKLRLY